MNPQAQRLTNLLRDLLDQYFQSPDPRRSEQVGDEMRGVMMAAGALGLTAEMVPTYQARDVLRTLAMQLGLV